MTETRQTAQQEAHPEAQRALRHVAEQIARTLCDADDTMEHHEQTDDHPCARCLRTGQTLADAGLRPVRIPAVPDPWPTNSHGLPHSAERVEIDRVARLLIAEWERVEQTPMSAAYIATFADMARAVIADRAGETP